MKPFDWSMRIACCVAAALVKGLLERARRLAREGVAHLVELVLQRRRRRQAGLFAVAACVRLISAVERPAERAPMSGSP